LNAADVDRAPAAAPCPAARRRHGKFVLDSDDAFDVPTAAAAAGGGDVSSDSHSKGKPTGKQVCGLLLAADVLGRACMA
jgi:hypothetical protein